MAYQTRSLITTQSPATLSSSTKKDPALVPGLRSARGGDLMKLQIKSSPEPKLSRMRIQNVWLRLAIASRARDEW